jgi:hypothetical protein
MNTAAAAKTTIGQTVEVEVTDFTPAGFAAGLPKVWVRGVITSVNPIGDKGHMDVMIRTEDGGYQPRIVGKRGGNKTFRVIA